MKIIIVGAGKIGTNLAKSLADENNEVYLIEREEKIVQKNIDKLDVKMIIGNGSDPDVLRKAQVQDAELVLAVTTSDETNLVVCAIAGLLGAKRRIARVRNMSLSQTLVKSGYAQFNIDEIINPELVAAQAIIKLIEAPGSSEVADFANGRVLLRGFDIPPQSPLCGLKIEEAKDEDFPWPFLIISIVRNNAVLIPKGDTTIEASDRIYALLPSASLGEFLTFVNPEVKLPKKVIIYGASIVGRHVATVLSKQIRDTVLLEENAELAQEIAGELEAVRVINGSPSEADILNECGIEVADIFIAASNDDHGNLITSVLAKKMGAKMTIVVLQRQDFLPVVHALGIDATINPYHLAVDRILRLARGKSISSVAKLLEGETEALEFVPEEGSPVTRGTVSEIKLPKGSIVGAIYDDKSVLLAKGDTRIEAGKKVVVFCQKAAVKKLQALFTR